MRYLRRHRRDDCCRPQQARAKHRLRRLLPPACARLGRRRRDACYGRPMKVKGPGRDFGTSFGHRIGRGRVSEGRRSASVASVSTERLALAAIRPVSAGVRPGAVGAGGCRRGSEGGERLGCGWARVEDVSKRRRQGLVVCRAMLPFEGLVMRAPLSRSRPPSLGAAGLVFSGAAGSVFAGLAACQSETIRV